MLTRETTYAFNVFGTAEVFKFVAFEATTVVGSDAPWRSVVCEVFG